MTRSGPARAATGLFRVLGLVLLASVACFALDLAALKPDGYVTDFSRVLDAETERELERYCARLDASTKAQLAIVTLPSLDGDPIEDVANSLYRQWGVGQKGTNEGALLLLITDDRKMRLEVGYGLEPILPDGFAGSLLREMRPSLREGDYAEALRAAAQTLGARIAEAKNVSLSDVPRRRARRTADDIPWPVLLGGLFLLLLLFSGIGRGGRRGGSGGGGFLPGLVLGSVLNSGRGYGHSRGGGGFGGWDSNDSFGGFGGGDSGGGGASSDW